MRATSLAVVLGAGFSKWAANLPLGSELFDFAIRAFGVREERRLERVADSKSLWDAMNASGLAEQFIADMLHSEDARRSQDTIWYVVRRLSEPYIWQEWHARRVRRHVLMIDENRKWDRPGIRQTAAFIEQCGIHLCGVITLNYDLLVEYALGSRGFNYGNAGEVLRGRGPYPVSQWRNPVTLAGRLPLAKLHGSISWDTYDRYTDGRRALSGQALIVAPTPEKSPPKELQDQWDLSRGIIQKASRLLVFGFGFNEYDEAVLKHVGEAGTHLQQIAVVDVSSRKEAAQKLWPGAHVEMLQPPPEGATDIEDWLRRPI